MSNLDPENLWLERAWVTECSRCANESSSFASEMHEARAEFASLGWTAGDDGYHLCPQCNGGNR